MAEQIELAGHKLSIRRHPTARRVRLSVDPRDGGLRLTLPKRAGLTAALRWAREHLDWVAREVAKRPTASPIYPGMEIALGDELLRLDWSAAHARVVRRVGMTVCVGGDEAELAARVLRWLKREAQRALSDETRLCATRAHVSVGRIGVGDARSRWGSCSSKGDIRYNWRLVLAPEFVRRAIVAHEVAHRVHMNHGPAFHALVSELLDADPKAASDWLRAHGQALHQFGRTEL